MKRAFWTGVSVCTHTQPGGQHAGPKHPSTLAQLFLPNPALPINV